MESEGTKKLIALAGPLIDVLNNGRVLFLDEIDARFHPYNHRFSFKAIQFAENQS
jgi:AAA15 family ATPase/GTPase